MRLYPSVVLRAVCCRLSPPVADNLGPHTRGFFRVLGSSSRSQRDIKMIVFRLLRNRNFMLILAFVLGIALGKAANWTEQLTLPALALVMTVSTLQIPSRAFLPLRGLVRPMLLAVVFNYLILN